MIAARKGTEPGLQTHSGSFQWTCFFQWTCNVPASWMLWASATQQALSVRLHPLVVKQLCGRASWMLWASATQQA